MIDKCNFELDHIQKSDIIYCALTDNYVRCRCNKAHCPIWQTYLNSKGEYLLFDTEYPLLGAVLNNIA